MKLAFELIPKEFVSDTAFYDYKDPMSEALSKVNKFGAVVVYKDGAYYGMVDDRSIAQKGSMKIPQNFPIGKYAKQVPILDRSSDIKQAIKVFYDSKSKAVPLSENNKIKGILKRTDILKSILSLHLLASYKASNVMSTPVIAIDQEASLDRARHAMSDNKVNRLAVMDKGRLFGVITYKNIIESSMSTANRSPEFSPKGRVHARVADFAHRNVHIISPDDNLDQVIRELIKNNVSSLLVMSRGKPVGVLSIRDILETVVKNANIQRRNIVLSGMTPELQEYEDEIIAALEAFAERVDKFRDVKVDYIAVNVKKIKTRQYEMKARVGLVHGGAVTMNSSAYSLEQTTDNLTDKLYKAIETKNDIVITSRKM